MLPQDTDWFRNQIAAPPHEWDSPTSTREKLERRAEFDRWLAEHDREVAQNAVNRFYNLLALKGEYRDIYGLAYIGDLVNKEFRGEVTVVVEGAQIYGEPV